MEAALKRTDPTTTEWPVKDLSENPLNPRDLVRDEDVGDLVESIRQHGVLQPLLITPDGVVIAGHRRRCAARLAGLVTVPVHVRSLGERQQIEAMLTENLQRKDLSVVQIGRAFLALQQRGATASEIAARHSMSEATVGTYLIALKLPPEVQAKLANHSLPIGAVRALARLPHAEQQRRIGLQAAAEGWLQREIDAAVAVELHPTPSPVSSGKPAAARSQPTPPVTARTDAALAATRAILQVGDYVVQLRRVIEGHPDITRDPRFKDTIGNLARVIRECEGRRAA